MNSPTPAELRPKTFMGKIKMTGMMILMAPMLRDDPNSTEKQAKQTLRDGIWWIWTGKEPKK